MSFENFDKKIKKTLEDESSPYDPSAWSRMKSALDHHLPQKKDNSKKFILFLFFFLLLGGGAAFFVFRPAFENRSDLKSLVQDNRVKKEIEKNQPAEKVNNNPDSAPSALNNYNSKTSPDKSSIINSKISGYSDNTIASVSKKTIPKQTDQIVNKTDRLEEKKNNKNSKADEQPAISEIKQNELNEISDKKETAQAEKVQPVLDKKTETEEAIKPQLTTDAKKVSTKKKNAITNNILINFSVGPDISSVGNNTGKAKISTGIGIGYIISKRLTIKTGFFTGRKIYTAGPENYNPPPNFWNYYPNLKQIDADCKVFEIPLNLDYKFAITKKDNWFFTAGASSYIMKKEKYNYYYKPANSPQYVTYSRTYENNTKHYFSILNIGGGYARKVTPSLTLQAEPYMKIALRGVGYGKVKLNSTGILITASIHPFVSKPNSNQ